MKPCLDRCMDCYYIEEVNKRVRCLKKHFDVKLNDGILLVPFDFECIDFIRKDLYEKGKEENREQEK